MTYTLDKKIAKAVFAEHQQLYLTAFKLALAETIRNEGIPQARRMLYDIANDLWEFDTGGAPKQNERA